MLHGHACTLPQKVTDRLAGWLHFFDKVMDTLWSVLHVHLSSTTMSAAAAAASLAACVRSHWRHDTLSA